MDSGEGRDNVTGEKHLLDRDFRVVVHSAGSITADTTSRRELHSAYKWQQCSADPYE